MATVVCVKTNCETNIVAMLHCFIFVLLIKFVIDVCLMVVLSSLLVQSLNQAIL